MAHTFPHSRVVMKELAERINRAEPDSHRGVENYVDECLEILGVNANYRNTRDDEDVEALNDLIQDQIEKTQLNVAIRCREHQAKIRKSQRDVTDVVNSVDRHCNKLNQTLEKHNEELKAIRETCSNNHAFLRNGNLCRLDMAVLSISRFVVGGETIDGAWIHPFNFPSTVNEWYQLAQRAMGIVSTERENTTMTNRPLAQKVLKIQHRAQQQITDLARFYDAKPRGIEATEDDDTDSDTGLDGFYVTDWMECLMAKIGLKWENVRLMGEQHYAARDN